MADCSARSWPIQGSGMRQLGSVRKAEYRRIDAESKFGRRQFDDGHGRA
jgi:hypothetical protein